MFDVRYGLIGSILFHIVVLGLIIFNFAGSNDTDALPPVPVSVEIMSAKDYSERQAGKTDSKIQKPATPPADVKAADAQANAKKEMEPKPSPKPAEKEALAPPPPKAAASPPPAPVPMPPKPAEVKPVEQPKVAETPPPAPPKPASPPKLEKVEPKPVAEKAIPKPAPKKEPEKKVVAKKVEEPKKVEEHKPVKERTFDPDRIAASLQKDAPHSTTAQSTIETPPMKLLSDRQAAVINRDPNAGTLGGNFEKGKPWRQASSLQDQASGVPQATGQMNAGSCADLIQSRIEQNWDLPIGALSAENTVVRLRIELNKDGSLRRDPTVLDGSSSPSYQTMADAAVRAALKGQPYVIPAEQFDRCRDLILRFNPHDMYGG